MAADTKDFPKKKKEGRYAGLVKALQEIAAMKREPGETNDTYAFNRCWHIATEALTKYKNQKQ